MEDARKTIWMMLVGSGIFAVLVGMDLVNDYQSGSTGRHLILEGVLLAFSGGVFVMGVRQLTRAKQEVTVLKSDLDRVHHEKEQWKIIEGIQVKSSFSPLVKVTGDKWGVVTQDGLATLTAQKK